jgi:xanthine dehydrogenase YagS FAD-binding subunit
MAYRPWRALDAEHELTGKSLNVASAEAAAVQALKEAKIHADNGYKPELARRTIVRALLQAKALPVAGAPE